MNKAMMAITRSMKRSLKSRPLTLQSQMHNFAAGTVGKSKTKRGGVINVNPPSIARQTFKVPGRGPAPLGRPLRDRAGQTQMFITDDRDIIARSDGNFSQQTKKTHKFAKILERNTSAQCVGCPCIFYDPVSDTIIRRGGYRGIFRKEGVDIEAYFNKQRM